MAAAIRRWMIIEYLTALHSSSTRSIVAKVLCRAPYCTKPKNTSITDGPSLDYFLRHSLARNSTDHQSESASSSSPIKQAHHLKSNVHQDVLQQAADNLNIPYLNRLDYNGDGRKVLFETYGCQMNVNDTEIAWSILNQNGFQRTDDASQADVIFIVTCSIREGAEKKIWARVDSLQALKHKRKSHCELKIGILGCMAERLKEHILEKKRAVDLICGPDAYKDLPRLLAITKSGQTAANVLLSLEETYADVMPVRINSKSPTAFVSIMRGCDNMCSFCIVPFTRGRERSRPISSILEEICHLRDQGIKEVTLLGQNVNSYRDLSELTADMSIDVVTPAITHLAKGFKTVYKPKIGGRRFVQLLEKVSDVCGEMRIRFTSPHPKDFPNEVLDLIYHRNNICKQIHIPAQSGSTSVLQTMRRGYSRDAYLELVGNIKSRIPNVCLSSDFIAGFCGETEVDHEDTISLLESVRFHRVFHFPYSMREKTHAHRRLTDDVPEDVKLRRHEHIGVVSRRISADLNSADIGKVQLVMVEGVSKRSDLDMAGRNDGNTKVIIPKICLPDDTCVNTRREIQAGDYVAVQITAASSQTLRGTPLYITSVKGFHQPHASQVPAAMRAESG